MRIVQGVSLTPLPFPMIIYIIEQEHSTRLLTFELVTLSARRVFCLNCWQQQQLKSSKLKFLEAFGAAGGSAGWLVVTIPTGQQPRNFRIEPKRQKTRETINGVPLFHGFLKTIGSPLSLRVGNFPDFLWIS